MRLVRPVVPEAEAEQSVDPVIVMPAVPKIDRRRYVTKRDLFFFDTDEEQCKISHITSREPRKDARLRPIRK